MIWKKDFTVEKINKRCEKSLCDYLGIEFIEIGPDYLQAKMPVDERTMQPMGIVHGGATAALAETVASVAASCVVEEGVGCVGLELNINHIRAVGSGWVIATTKPLHIGKSTQVWNIDIVNEKGQRTSAARLTLAVIKDKFSSF